MVATRGRMYIESAAGSESGSSSGNADAWRNVRLPEVKDVIKNRMFYC
jgi:hypothetical protein